MIYGYIRVSTADQNLENTFRLWKVSVIKIFYKQT